MGGNFFPSSADMLRFLPEIILTIAGTLLLILEAFIGGTPQQKPEHYRHASPITWVSNVSAPTLSLYGARDHIVEARFGRMLDAALEEAGATSVLLELPWSEHSFDAVPNGMGRHVSLTYTERFIAWAAAR